MLKILVSLKSFMENWINYGNFLLLFVDLERFPSNTKLSTIHILFSTFQAN